MSEEEHKRLPVDEIYKLIFNELSHSPIMTPIGLAKSSGLQKQTVDKYIGRIIFIQNQPKLIRIKTKNEEFLRFERNEVESE